ncbi:hypothetical protein CANARDRAFT_27008 [[Candida] arabinofermentans NRRL YB-2248]|uniref:Anaphase-promoting complex subunit 4 WD40 domain-containing protein n=1 Tax=[Candida] arabinofermentans NRRL YB-2248 TaxID=983967 RepID=A0A1E4T4B3_9ASCO|nr:hypothetical protein CANARDRAFT_27008 [[Candida] arabinofermentans NRRL YB-2248]
MKQYISTFVVGEAHDSDILDVAISKDFTITCSADGYLKLWNNDPNRALRLSKFVDKLGLHHISVFEDVIDAQPMLLLATVSFSGKSYFYQFDFETSTLLTIKDLPAELTNTNTFFWANAFAKDSNSVAHTYATTLTTGASQVYRLTFDKESNLCPKFQFLGITPTGESTFATCIDLDVAAKKLVVGYQNGSVHLYDLDYLKPLYEFQSFGLTKNTSSSSLSAVRNVKFSPAGKLLAVARDSGSYGTITLYDVKYCETIGSLTISTHSSNVGIGGYAHDKWCLSIAFNEDGSVLASGGLDDKIRLWNVETKERDATISISKSDVSDNNDGNRLDEATCCSLSFIKKGLINGEGDNDGLVAVGFDRVIRWFREAGGI